MHKCASVMSCGFLFRNDNTTVIKTTLMVLPSHFKHSSSRVMSYAINFLNYLRNRVHPHAWKCKNRLVCLWCQSGRWHRHHADFSSEMTTRLWLSLTGVTHISLQKWQHDCDWVRLEWHTFLFRNDNTTVIESDWSDTHRAAHDISETQLLVCYHLLRDASHVGV